MKLLPDSVILINHFNAIAVATDCLSKHHADAAISATRRAKVFTGFAPRTAAKVMRFLDCFPTPGIDAATADLATTLRRNHGWKLSDAYQAAIAQQHGL